MNNHTLAIQKAIPSLTDTNKVLFATLIAERLLPNYQYFEKRSNWGNHVILKDAITTLYQIILKGLSFEQTDIDDLIKDVESITPDMDDFSETFASFALDACASILSIFDYLLNKNNDYINYVSTYATDTVDAFVQEKENLNYNTDPLLENKINNDLFMIAEKAKQINDIQKLQSINNEKITPHIISSLKSPNPIIDLTVFDN